MTVLIEGEYSTPTGLEDTDMFTSAGLYPELLIVKPFGLGTG